MIRVYAGILILLGGAAVAAQEGQRVFEITGTIKGASNARVTQPIDVSVGPCHPVVVDSFGVFRADCSNVNVHAGQPILIRVEKDGWIPYMCTTAAPEGGNLADPIKIEKTTTPRPSATASTLFSRVKVFPKVTEADFNTTLSVVLQNLSRDRIFVEDAIIHVDQTYEIRHAITPIAVEIATPGAGDLSLHASQSESLLHIGIPIDSLDEASPITFHVRDDSAAADRDFIYRGWIEVTWRRPDDPRTLRAIADLPLFLVRGQRQAIELRSANQEQAEAALQWDHQQLQHLTATRGQRTSEVQWLIAKLNDFAPKNIQPDLTLTASAKSSVDTVYALLLAGADRDQPHDPKSDLIYEASRISNWELVKFLIEWPTSDPLTLADALYLAARSNEQALVSWMIAAGVHPYPALRGASQTGNLEIVQLAFNHGANPKELGLCSAVIGRNIEVLKLFLAKGVKVEDECSNEYYDNEFFPQGSQARSAVALAAQTLQEDMLRVLLDNLETSDSEKHKLLGSLVADAILDGLEKHSIDAKRPVVALLLKFNADVRGFGGKLIASDPEIAKMLINAGANVNAPGGNNYDFNQFPYRRIMPSSKQTSDFDFENGSSLLYAVQRGCDLNLVKVLRDFGAKKVAFRLTQNGNDGLQDAMEWYDAEHTAEAFSRAECLLLAGADPTGLVALSRRPWLIQAAASKDVHLVQLLLENGADPNIQDTNGNTALLAAFEDTHGSGPPIELVRVLLAKQANPNLTNKEGLSPLAAAFECTEVPIGTVQLLEKSNAKYDLTGFSYLDYSPLTKCVSFDDLPCVKYLLSKGEDPRKRDRSKTRPTDYKNANPEIQSALRNSSKR